MRQVDVLACGCIPIYIADNMTLPFSDLIPWEKISLFLPENIIEKLDPKIILDYLEQFTDEEVLAIQKRLNHGASYWLAVMSNLWVCFSFVVYREFLLDMEGRSVGAMHSYWLQHQRVLERKNNKKWFNYFYLLPPNSCCYEWDVDILINKGSLEFLSFLRYSCFSFITHIVNWYLLSFLFFFLLNN